MLVREIVGKAITNIHCIYGKEQGWLDTAECFLELDKKLIIDIPYSPETDISVETLPASAQSLFKDLSDTPVFFVNKEGKTVDEISMAYKKKQQTLWAKLKKTLLGLGATIKDYAPYKVEYQENKLKHIVNRKVVDFLWYDKGSEKGFLVLDNGYIVTDVFMAPHGTGLAGLNLYKSIDELIDRKGGDFLRLSKEDNSFRKG